MEPGTWLLAEGPYGAVTARRRSCRHVLLVAGGVGITPLRAPFETMPAPGADVLLYRAELFAHLVPDLLSRDVYLCGAPGFATAVRRSVKRLGLPDAQLHEERFDF